MAENIETHILEHLKRFQSTLERVESKQDEMVRRMSGLESGMIILKRDVHHGDETDVHLQLTIDRISSRLDRIEHRLELV